MSITFTSKVPSAREGVFSTGVEMPIFFAVRIMSLRDRDSERLTVARFSDFISASSSVTLP